MSTHVLERAQYVDRPLDELFAFFAEARNLERLTPRWLRFEVLTPAPIAMEPGARIEYRLSVHGVPLRWVSLIESWEPGRRFVDRQVQGPYKLWHHTHEFEALGSGTLVRDRVRYAVPFGPVGDLARFLFVRRDLDRVFAFRHAAVSEVFR